MSVARGKLMNTHVLRLPCKYKYKHENNNYLIIQYKSQQWYQHLIPYHHCTKVPLQYFYVRPTQTHNPVIHRPCFFSVSPSACSCLTLPGWPVNHRKHTMCQISKEASHTHTQAYPELNSTTHLSATEKDRETEMENILHVTWP